MNMDQARKRIEKELGTGHTLVLEEIKRVIVLSSGVIEKVVGFDVMIDGTEAFDLDFKTAVDKAITKYELLQQKKKQSSLLPEGKK
jgi:hypothetical protein